MQLAIQSKWIGQACRRKWLVFSFVASRRSFAVSIVCRNDKDGALASRTRNIGIIAHIDAGKTTTTERMLYYSGYTRRIGDVDDGSTVTDFLPAERARGITIQSAAITFQWPPPAKLGTEASGDDNDTHTINLIDTPGHADFTFEVIRSLRILDGAVCILDGVAGVEAQTEKVWHQARNHQIPRILYVNKLDRDGAAFGKTIKEIASKLNAWPAVCHIPWFENGKGRFEGVVDIVQLRALRWKEGADGKVVDSYGLDELETMEPDLHREAKKARIALVELLSEHDDAMVEQFLEYEEDHLAIPPTEILSSLRRCLLDPRSAVVPVFAGASFRNIGVQPLLDAVIALLPNPDEAPDPEFKAGNITGGLSNLVGGKIPLPIEATNSKRLAKKVNADVAQNLEACALAFKVVNDLKRGILVYVRVYHGVLKQGSNLFNTNLRVTERVPRLLKMYASDAEAVDFIGAGQIGVIPGLKHARTGDTLISYTGVNPKVGPPAPLNDLQLRPIEVPPPVFFASILPHSLGEQKAVSASLEVLLREDPSLQLSEDEESGQTLLSGMGELHLEIARDRLIQDFKAKASMGKIEIGYRECISAPSEPKTSVLEREIAGKFVKAGCSVSLSSFRTDSANAPAEASNSTLLRDGNEISIEIVEPGDPEDGPQAFLPGHLPQQLVIQSLQHGALAALARGPQHAFQMHNTRVKITLDPATHIFGTDTTLSSLSSAARLATASALQRSNRMQPTALMEPVMNVIIGLDEGSLGTVVQDLTSARGAHILSLDDADSDGNPGESGGGAIGNKADDPTIDLRRVYAPPDPFDAPAPADNGGSLPGGELQQDFRGGSRTRTITARVPLREMIGYLKVLRSHSAGRGTFVMSVDRFEKMGSQRQRAVLKELRGF